MIACRMAGYQGVASVLTAALRGMAERLEQSGFAPECEADVTTSGLAARALFDGVEAGEREVCYLASGYLSARVPALRALDLPYAAPEATRLFAALDGEAGGLIRKALEAATGLRLLGFWDNGLRHVSNGRRAIRAPGDCAGLVIRTLDSETYRQALAAMGFHPVVTDVLRLREAVASGEVDAQENPLTNLLGFGLHTHHRFVSLTGHIQGVVLLVANAAWHDRLAPAAREALGAAATEATALQRRLAAAEDARARRELASLGVEVLAPEAIDIDAFRAACAPVREAASAGLDPALLAALR